MFVYKSVEIIEYFRHYIGSAGGGGATTYADIIKGFYILAIFTTRFTTK